MHEELSDFVRAAADVPELGALLGSPQLDPTAKADAIRAITEGADELVRNFLLLLAEKGRAASSPRSRASSSRLVAQERRLEVDLTTAVELSDGEARDLVAQIGAPPAAASRRGEPSTRP